MCLLHAPGTVGFVDTGRYSISKHIRLAKRFRVQQTRALGACATMPRSIAAPQAWLQEFAWTADDKAAKQERRSTCGESGGLLAAQPMFCFEQAMRSLYWSTLVYDYREVRLQT